MKPVKDSTLDVLEEAAVEGAKAIKAFLVYQGENPQYLRRASIGVGAIGGFARVRASESNRMQIELIATRRLDVPERKQIAS